MLNLERSIYDRWSNEDQDHSKWVISIFFNAWVVDQAGQDAILGMDFMLPAGICLDLADGTLCSPDEVRILLIGQTPSYRATMQAITVAGQRVVIPARKLAEVNSELVHLSQNCGYDVIQNRC